MDDPINGISELETEIRLVRARNDRLEKEVEHLNQFAQLVKSYLDEDSSIHRAAKLVEIQTHLRKLGVK